MARPPRHHPARGALRAGRFGSIITTMEWTTPEYEELKMDAEIGSYQEDGEPVPIAEPGASTAAE